MMAGDPFASSVADTSKFIRVTLQATHRVDQCGSIAHVDDRWGIVRIKRSVQPHENDAASRHRLELGKGKDSQLHLADDGIKRVDQRRHLPVGHPVDELHEVVEPFAQLAGERSPRDRGQLDQPGKRGRGCEDLLRTLDGVEAGEDQHLAQPGRRLDPLEERLVERVGQQVGLGGEISQVLREVRSDVEDRSRMFHREPANPAKQRIVHVGMQVVAVGLDHEGLADQQPDEPL